MPDVTFHAPLLVAYPAHGCDVEEDVTLGCHQGALFATRRSNHAVHRASNLSFRRIVNFFDQVGTPLDLDSYFSYKPSDSDCLDICRSALLQDEPTKRKLHDGLGRSRAIVRHPFGIYLNKYHESIVRRAVDTANHQATRRKPRSESKASPRTWTNTGRSTCSTSTLPR